MKKVKAIELLTRQPEGGVNAAGIRAVVAQLAFDPVAWNQRQYMGTSWLDPGRAAYCFAGWTLLLAGQDLELILSKRLGDVPKIVADLLGLSRRQMTGVIMWGVNRDPHPTVEEFKAFLTDTTGVLFDTSDFDYTFWADEHALAGAAC